MELHDDIHQVAFLHYCSVSELIRRALELQFAADLAKVRQDPNRAYRLARVPLGRKVRHHKQGFYGPPRNARGMFPFSGESEHTSQGPDAPG